MPHNSRVPLQDMQHSKLENFENSSEAWADFTVEQAKKLKTVQLSHSSASKPFGGGNLSSCIYSRTKQGQNIALRCLDPEILQTNFINEHDK